MTVGAQLQEARTERKLSLADVSKETKIQPWVLEALEADRLLELMSPIYVKGFVATYAKFLHLQPEGLIAQLPWPKPEPEPGPVVTARPAAPVTLELPWPAIRRVGLALVGCAALAGIVALNPLRWAPKLSLWKQTRPALASVAPVREVPPPATPAALKTQPSESLELIVTAHRATWIRVRADGRLVTQQYLKRGANEQWRAKQKFEVIVAKPSQVDLTLNGQSISPFAIAHHGRLAISHQGVTQLVDDDF